MTWDGTDNSGGGRTKLYLNGKLYVNTTNPIFQMKNLDTNVSSNTNDQKIRFGQQGYVGYIDGVRITKHNVLADTNDPLYLSAWATHTSIGDTVYYNLPTTVAGAYGPDTPDVGTITLTATGAGDYTWSEVTGGTALPGSLAVGSTTHSGSGDSRTHTATVTGSFPELTSSFANGTRSDQTTNNILLKAQNDTDATKAITLGSSGGYDGIGITQKSTEKPVLFNARRYKGSGVAPRDINGFGFKPDFIWIKERDDTDWHVLYDSVRGNSQLYSNNNNSQGTSATQVTSFNSDGYTFGNTGAGNADGKATIAWAWKAGGVPSSSALSLSGGVGAGTIANDATGVSNVTSITQSVNQNVGFSITKYTGGGGAAAAFPHNLGGTPDWIIIKRITDDTKSWVVWHKDLTNATNSDNNVYNVYLDLDVAQQNATAGQHDHGAIAGPSSSVINVRQSGNVANVNDSSKEYICYAWKAVSGLSAFGSYTGNANNNSITSVGFKPKFLIIKRYNSNGSWSMWDTFRSPTGDDMQPLYTNGSSGDGSVDSTFTPTLTNTGFSFDSNVTHASLNGASQNYIYMAWA